MDLKTNTVVIAVKRIVGDRNVVEIGTLGNIDQDVGGGFYSVDWYTDDEAFSLSARPDEFEVTSKPMTPNIAIYDWRNENAGVAVSFDGTESGCSCYNVGEPSCPSNWDVSIYASQNGLNEEQEQWLRIYLAECVGKLLYIELLSGDWNKNQSLFKVAS